MRHRRRGGPSSRDGDRSAEAVHQGAWSGSQIYALLRGGPQLITMDKHFTTSRTPSCRLSKGVRTSSPAPSGGRT
ncbi:hypothetical protein CCMA1212_006444 [Trichoderma ghanense]|uniref:DUF5615 domain-containing protein n=1 Tax=Trichoderma ghanense TaxID=65468 RepID=A0ABY2GZV4_9HYPO